MPCYPQFKTPSLDRIWGPWASSHALEALQPLSVCLRVVWSVPCAIVDSIVAAMGGSYGFASTVSANLREKDDSWNVALGGFVAGSMVGLTSKA